MQTFSVLCLVFIVLLIGLILFFLALKLTEKGMKKKVTVQIIFKEFGQKMWMTIGLGCVFFCLFLLIVWAGSYFNDSQFRLNFFFLVYEHPVAFIYLGLLTFALISTGIYLVRLVIKHLYNTKSKY